eukprot:CAMPEP_0198445596 /NCGR_PEP_ID=MMETSP1453-20131121/594_1 /TAXON_ID=1461543 ORGANISM="Unidentified sp., Strain RCC701" /NCGR_SAMPLE_ID=MMETSP1453 /ASSEMBLY_ACC=CAM_ASM_001118 /LENGTH=48 /DNA_ID= /DNA_START= /DNA_END= /DNA_ORIENTATION=
MKLISVTFPVCHRLKSSLKSLSPLNSLDMSVTRDTSQSLMWPYRLFAA